MSRIRIALSILALLGGFGIMAISLGAANPVWSSEGGATQLRFYVDDEILPDHVLYPGLMAVDRLRLEAAEEPRDRMLLEIEFANRRLKYAQALVVKNNPGLALTTATKAEKYLIHAIQGAVDHTSLSTADREYVLRAAAYHKLVMVELMTQLPGLNTTVLLNLREQIEGLELRLHQVQSDATSTSSEMI